MARVVSWRISYGSDVYYAYITSPNPNNDEPVIKSDEPLSQSDANRIGVKVLSYENESVYESHFEAMRSKINSEIGHGEEIDLGGSAHRYWNVTNSDENEEVLMLVGADGRNTSEDLNPYYDFHLTNQAIAIGTGEDYTLDVDADIECEAFFERNGVRHACDADPGLQVQNNENFYIVSQRHGIESSIFTLRIKTGTKFNNDTHMLDCTIVGAKNGVTGKAVFTVSAVLGGKEGVSYDLIVSPKQFHFDSPQEAEASTGFVNVGVLRNGKKLTAAEIASENMKIGYEYDANGNNGLGFDNEDITIVTIPSDGVFKLSPSAIYAGGGSVTFYLVVDDPDGRSVVDSDSASVVVDGVDGAGHIYLELDNEVEAIGVGDDSDLDLLPGQEVTASTNVRMYSGETNLIITDIDVIDASVNSGKGTTWDEAPNTGEGLIDGSGQYYGTIRIILKNGFEFGEDLRDKVTVQVTGRHPDSSTMVATGRCAFTILGVKGGKDGVIYRLIPSCDYIMYDPNTAMVQCEAQEPIAVSELGNATIGATAYEGNYMKDPNSIAADGEFVRYSIGVTYSNAQTAYQSGIAPTTNGSEFTVPLSSILGDLGENNPASRYVTFYWIKKISTTYYLIDRETVPVITAGIDGNYAKIELGNEVDAITIGDDTKLDIDSGVIVEVGTTVRAIDGALNDLDILNVTAEVINDFNGWHTDSDPWPAAQFEVSTDDGETWITPVAGRAYKLWRFWYELPNGFDFGEDKKEKVKLEVRYALQDGTEHRGTAIFTIVGVPGGKEGQKYQLVPEVDIVRYFANDDVFDEETLNCDAIIGLERLEGGHIYYGTQVRTAPGFRVLDIIDSTFKNYYVEGSQAQVRGMYFGNSGIAQFGAMETSQIAWYLTIDTDEGELIVDHETVPIVSDGKDGDPAYTVELSNEIESISTGTDTSLGDMQPSERVTAMTEVYLLHGNEKVDIVDFNYEWLDIVSAGVSSVKLYKRSSEESTSYGGEISPSNFSKYTTLEVVLNREFDFGADMRKRMIVKVAYLDNISHEKFWMRGLFTLIGIKGGKDGTVYRILPTPDFIVYDFQSGTFPGGDGVKATAYNNGVEMASGTYEIYYSKDVVYDLDAIPSTLPSTFQRYNGGEVHMDAPVLGVEKKIVFYLKVDGKWVDRETVPLITNGKEGKDGKDGAGSIIFDLSNENWVVTTGDDAKLDITGSITGGTYVTCSSGTTYASIHIDTASTYSFGTASSWVNNSKVEIIDNDTPKPLIKVTLRDGFQYDSNTLRREIQVTAATLLDGFSGELTFNLVAVKNGHNGEEGVSYQLKTTAGSIVYDTNKKKFLPTTFDATLYEGVTALGRANYTLKVYDSTGAQVGATETASNASKISLNVGSFTDFPTVGQVRITATTADGGWDSSDIPVVCSGKDGSGILMDLTNDRDTIALGADLILDTSVNLGDSTTGTVFQGSTQLTLSSPYANVENFAQKNLVHASARLGSDNKSVIVSLSLDSGINFGNLEGNQFAIMVGATATDVNGETGTKEAKYTIHGFQGGEDGHVYRILPSCSTIKYDGKTNKYAPEKVSAVFTINGVEQAPEFSYMKLGMDLDDGSEIIPVEYQEGTELRVEDLVAASGLNNFLIFYAYDASGENVLDIESIPVVFDGHDGQGGVEAVTDPKFVNINVDENNKVKAGHTYTIRVGLMSGSTMADFTITNKSVAGFASNPATVGNGVAQSDKYQEVVITVPSTATFGDDGTAYVQFTCKSTDSTAQTRKVSFYMYAAAGGRGARGPLTRIREYNEEDDYQSGGESDTYLDFIYYGTSNFEGGYFQCKVNQNHTAVPPKTKTVNGEVVWDDTDANWIYYPTADFMASKVATFGVWPNGWVIDEGVIQHTSSSITLDSDGVIKVQEPAWNAYLYQNNANSSEKIYVPALNMADGETVMAYSGGTVNSGVLSNYSALSDGYYVYHKNGNTETVTVEVAGDSTLTSALYLNVNSSGIYQSGTASVVNLTKPVSQDLLFAVKFNRTPNVTGGVSTAYTYYYKIVAGTTNGILIATATNRGVQMRSAAPTDGENENNSEGVRMRVQVATECRISDIDLNTEEEYQCAIRSMTVAQMDCDNCWDCSSQCSCEGNCSSYCSTQCSSQCSECTSNCSTDCPSQVLYPLLICDEDLSLIGNGGTLITAFNEVVQNVGFVANTSVALDSNVLTKSFGNELVYFSRDLSNATFVLTIDNGDPGSTDDITKTFTKVASSTTNYRVRLKNDGGSQVKIMSVPANDYVNPVISIGTNGESYTKFYSDGRMVTTNGVFTGSIYAEDGVFRGSAYINEGTLNNVNVNGNLTLGGKNFIRMIDDTGKIRLEFSDQTVAQGDLGGTSVVDSYKVYTSFTATDKVWIDGKTFSTGAENIMYAYLSSTDKLKIPVIKVSYVFNHCRSNTKFTVGMFYENPAGGRVGLFDNNAIEQTANGSASGTFTTKSTEITGASGYYRVRFYIKGGFNKKLFGSDASMNVTISSSEDIKVTHVVQTSSTNAQGHFDKMTIGSNGFSYVTDDGGMIVICHEGAGNTSIKIQAKSNGNGIYIDNDEFMLKVNNVTYNVAKVMQAISNLPYDII